ncbi:paREP15, putative coiled-coil protein [Thermoproteus uzoniensis 768-20]|uniref:PaREP15, putative coiled-coil protein n=1 Tax=Thermoproteus uzoniensis (strain 768-20) TaxID=999630 RepID=F2L5Z1_THEU7|nr:paREP15, putative coiled-coil protein [Thermoproteus uzoniensis 768-20]
MSGEISPLVHEALRMAVEHALNKIKEGKKLSTEDIFLLYLGTILKEMADVRSEIARLEQRIDENNRRIDETNKRIDDVSIKNRRREQENRRP